MKKFMFILMVALVGGISKSSAQNTLVATLTHGDEITMFYGINAFVKAHNAAVDGDIINLSGGKFNSTTITKGITIRGTGTYVANIVTNPTHIINTLEINLPETATDRLSIEGCTFDDCVSAKALKNAYFLKNSFNNGFFLKGVVTNTTFVNCSLSGSSGSGSNGIYSPQYKSSIQFINCKIYYVNISAGTFAFINCLILPNYGYEAHSISNSSLVNCILYYTSTSTPSSRHQLPATSSAWNCVAVGAGAQNVFANLSSPQNCTYATKEIFIDGSYFKDLTDEAKATYLGNDGTPVGIYGGVFPYDMTPTYPQITKMNVANKTTADGKLSVEIEVSATE